MIPGSSEPRILRILTGCTAVGKTEAALAWAVKNDAEILSCDSLLFYRGMDIGTAKPSPAELARVPHHLIDLCEPRQQMDISRYLALALSCAEEIHARGKRVLVTGGSGFYLKCFFAPVVDDVTVSSALRAQVGELTAAAALEQLVRLNPAGLGELDIANPRRVFRALERCLASGKTLAELAERFAAQKSPFAGWQLCCLRLDRPKEELDVRIKLRVDQMLHSGLVQEVERLQGQGLRENLSAARAIGYRETLAMLDGKLRRESLAEEICANTRALVKKQRTWFRTQIPPHSVQHPDDFNPLSAF